MEGKNKGEILAKQKRVLEQWLTPATGDGTAAKAGQFADPAAHVKE